MRYRGEFDETELLWEMGRRVPSNSSPDLPDHRLVAYREGRLSRADAESCEHDLGRSVEARARLAELAVLESVTPSAHVRQAVLASFDGSFRLPAAPACEPARGPLRGSLLKAAAIAVFGLGMLLLMQLSLAHPSQRTLPPDLAYEVQAEGLAQVRRPAPGGREIEAYPETRVRITVSPRAAAVNDIEFGVYRESAARLERLHAGIETRAIRGAAVVTAEARDLVSPDAESARLYLVAARPGDFPATLEVGQGAAGAALEEAGRRRAYPFVIHLRPVPAGL